MPLIADCKKVAVEILNTTAARVDDVPLRLAVIKIGDDPASSIYVKKKKEACSKNNINFIQYDLENEVSFGYVAELIRTLNDDPLTTGILLQLPLPRHLDTIDLLSRIRPDKDVDGLCPENMGLLALGRPRITPCTPLGIINILQYYSISPTGKHAVIIGDGIVVGRPMALELLNANATVTVCNIYTQNLADIVKMADILISATGVSSLVPWQWIKQNAVVIDVGISRRDDDNTISGDISNDALYLSEAKLMTKVPGGVGITTVAAVIQNVRRL